MNTIQKLCNTQPYETVRVVSIDESCPLLRRFIDVGLTCGTEIYCALRSPSGGMSAYMIRGATVAIRDRDCEYVLVERYDRWD